MSSSYFKEIVILPVRDIQVSKYHSHRHLLSDLKFDRKEIPNLPHSKIFRGLFQGTQGVQIQVLPTLCISLVFCHTCPVLPNAINIRSNTAEMQVHSIQLCQLVSKTKREEGKTRRKCKQKSEKYALGSNWQFCLLKLRKEKRWEFEAKGNSIHHIGQMTYCNKVVSVIFWVASCM